MDELKPHYWTPSWMHMGDCMICGHVRDASIHLDARPATPPPDSTQVIDPISGRSLGPSD